jgi:hypothetical protein
LDNVFAQEWIGALVEDDGFDTLRDGLNQVDELAIAAAEVVARLLGADRPKTPETAELDAWVAQRTCPEGFRELALAAARGLRDEGLVADEWQGDPAWLAEMDALIRALEG